MRERYDLREMLREIREDEEFGDTKSRRISQEEIQKKVQDRRRAVRKRKKK